MATNTSTITTASDFATTNLTGGNYLEGSILAGRVGSWWGGSAGRSFPGMRFTFTNAIAAGSTITDAYVTVYGAGSSSPYSAHPYTVYSEASASPATFSSGAPPYLRTKGSTGTAVTFPNTAWQASGQIDVTAQVQERFTAQGQFLAGSSIAFLFDEAGDTANDGNWRTYSGSTTGQQSQLVITYTPAGGNVPPSASFTASPTSGDEPLTVGFTDTSTPGTGTINQWSWNFGDGQTSTLQNPTHSFAADGSYSVTLTVTDDNALNDISSATTITVNNVDGGSGGGGGGGTGGGGGGTADPTAWPKQVYLNDGDSYDVTFSGNDYTLTLNSRNIPTIPYPIDFTPTCNVTVTDNQTGTSRSHTMYAAAGESVPVLINGLLVQPYAWGELNDMGSGNSNPDDAGFEWLTVNFRVPNGHIAFLVNDGLGGRNRLFPEGKYPLTTRLYDYRKFQTLGNPEGGAGFAGYAHGGFDHGGAPNYQRAPYDGTAVSHGVGGNSGQMSFIPDLPITEGYATNGFDSPINLRFLHMNEAIATGYITAGTIFGRAGTAGTDTPHTHFNSIDYANSGPDYSSVVNNDQGDHKDGGGFPLFAALWHDEYGSQWASPREWLVLGPLTQSQDLTIDESVLPQDGDSTAFGTSWEYHTNVINGIVNIEEFFNDAPFLNNTSAYPNSQAYVCTYVISDSTQAVTGTLEHAHTAEVYVNGSLVHSSDHTSYWSSYDNATENFLEGAGTEIFPIGLNKGRNTIITKVTSGSYTAANDDGRKLSMSLRIGASDGTPSAGVYFTTDILDLQISGSTATWTALDRPEYAVHYYEVQISPSGNFGEGYRRFNVGTATTFNLTGRIDEGTTGYIRVQPKDWNGDDIPHASQSTFVGVGPISIPPSETTPLGDANVDVTPQIVVIGSDDNNRAGGMEFMRNAFAGRTNPAGTGNAGTHDGEQIHMSFYIIGTNIYGPNLSSSQWRDEYMALYEAGHEIGNHGFHGLAGDAPRGSVSNWLNNWIVPTHEAIQQMFVEYGYTSADVDNHVIGYMSAQDEFDQYLYEALDSYAKYEYHASIANGHAGYLSGAAYPAWFGGTADVPFANTPFQTTYAYPGLFDLPQTYTQNPEWNGVLGDSSLTYDRYCDKDWFDRGDSGAEWFASIQGTFLRLYNGNRAPLVICTHSQEWGPTNILSAGGSGQLTAGILEKQAAFNNLLDWLLSGDFPDVRIMSRAEYLDWLKAPAALGATAATGGPSNSPPVLDPISNETVSTTLNLSVGFTDVDDADQHTASINWGDGNSEAGTVNQTTNTITASHTYSVDGSYTVSITVTDGQGASDTLTKTVTVNGAGSPNTAPDVYPINNATVVDTYTLLVFYDEPDGDTVTATIDWGDGNVEAGDVQVNTAFDGAIAGVHTYVNTGTYTVTVTVTDDRTPPLSDSSTFTVTVVGGTQVPDIFVTVDEDTVLRSMPTHKLGASFVFSSSIAGRQSTYPGNSTLLKEMTKLVKWDLARFAGGLEANHAGWVRTGGSSLYTTISITPTDDFNQASQLGWGSGAQFGTYEDTDPNSDIKSPPYTLNSFNYNAATGNPVARYWWMYTPETMADLYQYKTETGIDIMIQANVYDNNPDMWVDMLTHCNITNNYGFMYWELGNEPDLANSELFRDAYGSTHSASATEMGYRVARYQAAMKAVDPNVKLFGPVIANPTEEGTPSVPNFTWFNAFKTSLLANGGTVDGLAYHHYQIPEFNDSSDRAKQLESFMSYNTWVYNSGNGTPGAALTATTGLRRVKKVFYDEVYAKAEELYPNVPHLITEMRAHPGTGNVDVHSWPVMNTWFVDAAMRGYVLGDNTPFWYDTYEDGTVRAASVRANNLVRNNIYGQLILGRFTGSVILDTSHDYDPNLGFGAWATRDNRGTFVILVNPLSTSIRVRVTDTNASTTPTRVTRWELDVDSGFDWDSDTIDTDVMNINGFKINPALNATQNLNNASNTGLFDVGTVSQLPAGTTYSDVTMEPYQTIVMAFSDGPIPADASDDYIIADATLNTQSGTATLNVTVTDDSSASQTINSWTINWGDGTSPATFTTAPDGTGSAAHNYTTAGTYSLIYSATSSYGTDDKIFTITVVAADPPTAVASVNTSSGDEPLTVNLSDASTGDPATSWSVDWGDGSAIVNFGSAPAGTGTASHVYANNGNYTLTYTVGNANGSTQDTVAITVAEVIAPTAAATFNATGGTEPFTIELTDNSSGPDAATGWRVDWGDGSGIETFGSTPTAETHEYTLAGSYTLTYYASNYGGEDTQTYAITVTGSTPPAPTASFTFAQSGANPLSYQFTNTSTGNPSSFAWDFDDGGATSTVANPLYTFSGTGTYSVQLTATNAGGSSIDTQSVSATAQTPPTPDFTWAADSLQNWNIIHFEDASSGTVNSYAWDFGDGTTSTLANPTKTYSVAGVYPVVLAVTNFGGTTIKVQNVTVEAQTPPVPSFTYTITGNDSLTVNFTDATVGTVNSRVWNFGDGNTSSATNPSHTYSDYGTYNITLTTTNYGGTVVYAQQITVPNPNFVPLTADFDYEFSGQDGATVIFTDTSSGSDLQTWDWDFGDSSSSSLQNPSHTYAASGFYTVSLVITDSSDEADIITKTFQVVINTGLPPVAAAIATPQSGEAPLSVLFTDLSNPRGAAIQTWAWDFKDGTTSTSQHPTHVFSAAGTYNVSLTVTNSQGQSTTNVLVAVDQTVTPPDPEDPNSEFPTTDYVTVGLGVRQDMFITIRYKRV